MVVYLISMNSSFNKEANSKVRVPVIRLRAISQRVKQSRQRMVVMSERSNYDTGSEESTLQQESSYLLSEAILNSKDL